MSSTYVRTQFKQFLTTNAPQETLIDLTSDYEDLRQLISDSGIQPGGSWLGIQFIGGEELPASLAATNDQGKYREFGAISLHIAAMARLGVGDSIIARGEVLRNLLRGRRLGTILVTGMTTVNTDSGATLQFEGGYMSGTFQLSYQQELDL